MNSWTELTDHKSTQRDSYNLAVASHLAAGNERQNKQSRFRIKEKNSSRSRHSQ